jgi:hypothetical protein
MNFIRDYMPQPWAKEYGILGTTEHIFKHRIVGNLVMRTSGGRRRAISRVRSRQLELRITGRGQHCKSPGGSTRPAFSLERETWMRDEARLLINWTWFSSRFSSGSLCRQSSAIRTGCANQRPSGSVAGGSQRRLSPTAISLTGVLNAMAPFPQK